MKNFKRIQAMFLAVIMAVMTLGSTTAFAAESITHNDIPIASENNEGISPCFYDTDYIGTDRSIKTSPTASAAGYAFYSKSNEIKFSLETAGYYNVLAIRLHDITNGDIVVKEWQISKQSMETWFGVTKDHKYIFEYLVASGSGDVYVTNTIYAVYRA